MVVFFGGMGELTLFWVWCAVELGMAERVSCDGGEVSASSPISVHLAFLTHIGISVSKGDVSSSNCWEFI